MVIIKNSGAPFGERPSGLEKMIMENKKDTVNKEKAKFYFREKLICHVKKVGEGFVNGWFRSDIKEGLYYMFEDRRWPGEEQRLFLIDIFDVKDYKEEAG